MTSRRNRQLAVISFVIILSIVAASSPRDTAASRSGVWSTTSVAVAGPSEEAYVPDGEYIRGCTVDTVGIAKCFIESQPLQAVYLDAFYIDRTEVTTAQYAACVAAGVCEPPMSSQSTTRVHYYGNPTFANYPVIHVDWERADTYCRWLGKRLPSEAEWEKAARGTDHRLFPWGNEFSSCERCNCNTWYYNPWGELREAPCVGDTAPVGGYQDYASPYGVYDMVGNVREWVNDLYAKHYFVDSPYYNPPGPVYTQAGEHLVRGGSWKDTYTHGNAWNRLDEADIYQTHLIGFRCARSAPAGAPTPAPTPTPIPYDVADVGPEGGALWISPPDHMTLLAIPMDAFSVTEVITLSYSRQSNPQGDLQGMNHFFRLGMAQDGPGIYASQVLSTPARIVLAYRGSGGLVKDTIGLYQATAGGWITDGITTVARLPGYLVADVTSTGVYGLLGATHRVYMPTVLR